MQAPDIVGVNYDETGIVRVGRRCGIRQIVHRVCNIVLVGIGLFLCVGIDYDDPSNIMLDIVTAGIIYIALLFFGFLFYGLIWVSGIVAVDYPPSNFILSYDTRVTLLLIINMFHIILNDCIGFIILNKYVTCMHPQYLSWYSNFIGCGVIYFLIIGTALVIGIICCPCYISYLIYIYNNKPRNIMDTIEQNA